MSSVAEKLQGQGVTIDQATAFLMTGAALENWDAWCPDDGRPALGFAYATKVMNGGGWSHAEWERIKHGAFDACFGASKRWAGTHDKLTGAAYFASSAVLDLLNAAYQSQPDAIKPDLQECWARAISACIHSNICASVARALGQQP